MTTAWLEIATPRGDLALMQDTAAALDGYASTIKGDRDTLAQLTQMIGAEWTGEAADAFHVRSAAALGAVEAIGASQSGAAAILRGYALQWEATHKASDEAHSSIHHAVDNYRRDARSALDRIVDAIENFIHSNPLTDLASHLPGVDGILNDLRSWSAPGYAPMFFVTSNPYYTVHTAETVLGALKSGAEWGISHLMSALHTIADKIGGAIHNLIDFAHQVEHALASAVAAAQKLVHQAIELLFDIGKAAAKKLGQVIAAVAGAMFDAAVFVVRVIVEGMIILGKAIYEIDKFLTRLAIGLGLVAVIITKAVHGIRDERRMQPAAADRADQTATLNEYHNPDTQRYVHDRWALASNSYEHGDVPAPEGWDIVETFPNDQEGPRDDDSGFAATVYRNEATGEIVVAFRGSEGANFDIRDWVGDGVNATNLQTAQGRDAIEVAQLISNRYSGSDVSFTGHSLGGSLASMASIATGNPATTFNAAGVGDGNYTMAMDASNGSGNESQIVNYHTEHDALTWGQEHLGVRPAAGAQVQIVDNTCNAISAHDLKSFVLPSSPDPMSAVA